MKYKQPLCCNTMQVGYHQGQNTIKFGIPLRLEYQLIHGTALHYIAKGQWAPG